MAFVWGNQMRHKAHATGKKRGAHPLWLVAWLISITLPLSGCLDLAGNALPQLDIPQSYEAGPPNPVKAKQALPPMHWWRGFRSNELTRLIEEARSANLDIAVAIAQIEEADAQSRIAGAPLLPSVGLSGTATHARSGQTTTAGTYATPEYDELSGLLTASYEIDFWGKNRSALRAAEESATASRFNSEVVGLTTVVSVADTYFQLLAAQDRLRIARRNASSAGDILKLIRQQFAAGTASDLDVAQQESLVDTQLAAIPPLRQTIRQSKVALALLIARPPESVDIRGGSMAAIAIPRVTPGLPSELLIRRPDIREAKAQLASANATVWNARAQMLPSITLTGQGGYESAVLKTFLQPDSALYTLTAGLTQPVFDGGALQGNLDLQKAVREQLFQAYRKAVISAFGDVDNSLVAVRQTTLTEHDQRDLVVSARRAYRLSSQQFRAGTISLITLLQTEQTLFQAEDNLAQVQLTRLQAIVSLYQALGGGWPPKATAIANVR